MAAKMRIASEDETRAIPRRADFTKGIVEGAGCPARKNRAWLYDGRAAGLALMVTRAGSKAFYFYKKVNGRPQRVRLGGVAEISIEQARNMAVKLNGQIADGHDPMAEKNQARAEITVGEVFAWYMANHSTLHKRTAAEDQKKFDRHVSDWKNRKLTSISRADVGALHAKIGKTAPGAANRTLALLSSVFNKARNLGFDHNPVKGIQRFKETSRERFLQADELKRFMAALDAEPSEAMRDFFSMLLWTGARRGNVMSMRWAEMNLDAGTWTIPAHKFKTGHASTVHLAPPAMEILNRRSANSTGNEFVFPSTSESGHLEEPKKAWEALLKRAGIVDLRIHDLRRTLGSWMAAGGASLPVIGKTLGHRNVSTTAIYARLNLDPVRVAVNSAVGAMQAAGKK